MPKVGSNVSYKDFNKSIKHPFVIYADFESILEKIDTASPNPDQSYTSRKRLHSIIEGNGKKSKTNVLNKRREKEI